MQANLRHPAKHAQAEQKAGFCLNPLPGSHVTGLIMLWLQAALVTLVSVLNDAGVVSAGEVERLLERETLALNTAILDNR